MFNKILIANRGEIACRIIRSARRMGIKTVAVYSQADASSLHVQLADEAVAIGGAPARESYLRIDKIIAAAQLTGAQAVHPGYGFLSENASFASQCDQHGIVFIGPPIAAIEAMGSKSAAKQLMGSAGVPLVPGYHGDRQEPVFLKQQADDMGYPVLLKAAAGGGGKGMRQVASSEDFDEALEAAQRESMASFGDQHMLVEKYLLQPRHVEIQIFCDQQGQGVYLFERDCSVQRRHQKVIEEAPAPGLNEDLRAHMGETALRAAAAIGYCGAGTVEFLLAADGSFYFMEMNTRLQVEHPVTEMITGQDLVEWQFRVAAGESLPLSQRQLTISGHAFEARIYAEDPAQDFMPASGRLDMLQPPVESAHVRVDTGVRQGDEVTSFYDPMIAKLIVWDESRDRALARLTAALAEYRIAGLATNVDFLYNLASSQPFRQAELDTGFIERHHGALFRDETSQLSEDLPLAAVACVLLKQANSQRQYLGLHQTPWGLADSWRLNETHTHKLELQLGLRSFEVFCADRGDMRFELNSDFGTVEFEAQLSKDCLTVLRDGHRFCLTVAEHDGGYSLFRDAGGDGSAGAIRFSEVQPDIGEDDNAGGESALLAPMNGTIVATPLQAGDAVAGGDILVVMEAMKMEHTIRAPVDGQLLEYYCSAGDLVEGGASLFSFVPAE